MRQPRASPIHLPKKTGNMNKVILYLVSCFNPLWLRYGVDPKHLLTILEAKLTMDGRRKSAFSFSQRNKNKELSGQDWILIMMMTLMGLLFSIFAQLLNHTASGLVFYFSGWIMFIISTLIVDFTDVLIDVRDNYILLPKPIKDRTLALSRIIHVIVYLLRIFIPFNLVMSIIVAFKSGPLAMILFIILAFMGLLIGVLLVNLIYLLLIRLSSPQRFKAIVTYFQMFLYTFSIIGYQLVPRLIDYTGLDQQNLLENRYCWAIPSTWLAAIWELTVAGVHTLDIVVLASAGLLFPFVALYFITSSLTNKFSERLFTLASGGSAGAGAKKEKQNGRKPQKTWMNWTAGWACVGPAERSAYELTWFISGRSRDFQLKFYPNLVLMPVYFFIFVFLRDSDGSSRGIYLFVLYAAAVTLTSTTYFTLFSESFKAAWIQVAHPVQVPGHLLAGAFKAMMIKYLLPAYLLITALVCAFYGLAFFDDAILAFIFSLAIYLPLLISFDQFLPFSKAWEDLSKGSNTFRGIISMLAAALIGLLHYFIAPYPWVLYLAIVLGLMACHFGFKTYRNIGWVRIRNLS
jgi:ABC-2 type transport system permease protein